MGKNKTKKALLATTLVTSAVVASVGSVSAAPQFSDVPATHPFAGAIQELASRNVIKGFSDGTFGPSKVVTRGQAAVILSGVLGLNTKNVNNPNFKDVPTNNPYYGAVAALANAGVISGYDAENFGVNDPIQRNHMARILANAFHLKADANTKLPFTDVADNIYKESIAALYASGVTSGKSATLFGGKDHVTRGQLAAFVLRAEKAKSTTTLTVENVSDTKVTAGNEEYTIAADVKSILNSANNQALRSAVIEAKIVNGEIVEITAIELNAAGTSAGPVTLNGANTTFAGDVTVNADHVKLANVTITGDVTVSSKATSHFTAENVKFNGALQVAEASTKTASLTSVAVVDAFTFQFINSDVTSLQIARNNTTINSNKELKEVTVTASVTTVQLNATTTKVIVKVDGKLALTGTGVVNQVVVEKATELALKAFTEIKELNVKDAAAKVDLGTNIIVALVIVQDGKTLESVITNYSSVSNNIKAGKTSSGTSLGNTVSTGGGGGGSSKSALPSVIKSAGTYGPASGELVVNGNLTIASKDVVLRNVKVTGNLILDEAIGEGDVTLDGVTVEGQTIVSGGGTNSIFFKDSVLLTVIVNKNNGAVRIVAQGTTQVAEVQLETPAIVREEGLTGGSTGFEDIVVSEAMQPGFLVTLQGAFETINSRATNVRVDLSAETSIQSLILNALAQITGGTIYTAEINANGSTLSSRPQNLVLNINGGVTIDGTPVTESYSDPSITSTTLRGISAAPGRIAVDTEHFIATLDTASFTVTATLNGQPYTLENLQYNAVRREFTFNQVPLTDNIGKTLAITVASSSPAITGEAQTSSYVVGTGFSGTITDILGVGVSGLTIKFRAGSGTTEGDVVATATTDRYGNYSVNLPAGTYTGELSGAGYITTYLVASAPSDAFLTGQNETAIRAAASNQVKIVLTWGANPSDLDSHLTGPSTSGLPFHIAYYDKQEVQGDIVYADLDWDDVTSYGPETTTIRELVDGTYRFFVHNFSRDADLRDSGAVVTVYKGSSSTPINTFQIPAGDGTEIYWVVFDLQVSNNGETVELIPVNTFVQGYGPVGVYVGGEEVLDSYYPQYVAEGTQVTLSASENTQLYYLLEDPTTIESQRFEEEPSLENPEYVDERQVVLRDGTLYDPANPITITKDSVLKVVAVQEGIIVGERDVTFVIGERETVPPTVTTIGNGTESTLTFTTSDAAFLQFSEALDYSSQYDVIWALNDAAGGVTNVFSWDESGTTVSLTLSEGYSVKFVSDLDVAVSDLQGNWATLKLVDVADPISDTTPPSLVKGITGGLSATFTTADVTTVDTTQVTADTVLVEFSEELNDSSKNLILMALYDCVGVNATTNAIFRWDDNTIVLDYDAFVALGRPITFTESYSLLVADLEGNSEVVEVIKLTEEII